MKGLLLDPVANADERSALTGLITQFRQEVAALRAEVAGLRRENLELRQQAGYCKGMHAQAIRRLAALEQEVEQLRGSVNLPVVPGPRALTVTADGQAREA